MSAFDSSAGVSAIDNSYLVFLDFLRHLITHSTAVIAIAIRMTPPTLINTIARVLIESSSEFLLLFVVVVVVLFDVVLFVVLFDVVVVVLFDVVVFVFVVVLVVTGIKHVVVPAGLNVIVSLKVDAMFVVVVSKVPSRAERVPLVSELFKVDIVSSPEFVCSTTVRPVVSFIVEICVR